MSSLCVIKNCPGSTHRKKRGEKVYFYKALEDQLVDWNAAIPPWNDKIKINDRVCSRHFKDSDLIKEWNFVINDKTVTMPRGRWTLRVGAIPEIFDNYVDTPCAKRMRKSRPKSLEEPARSSSSDEDFENSPRKRPKKLVKSRSSKANKTCIKNDPRSSGIRSKSTVKSWKESNGNSEEQEAEWENSCINFVNQLNTIFCSPTLPDVSKSHPAKRGRGRPRKNPLVPVMKHGTGRPPKNQKPVRVSRTPTLHKHSTRSKQEKPFSSAASEVETENSALVERQTFPESGNDEQENLSWSSDDLQSSSESDAMPAKRGRGRPPKKKKTMLSVSPMGLQKSTVSGYDSDVEIVNAPDSSSDVSTEFSVHSQITIKAEKCDEGYKNCDSAGIKVTESFSVNSTSEDSAIQQRLENELNYEGVMVKREMCECEGLDSERCEPLRRTERFSKLPNSPMHFPETDHEESPVDREGDIEFSVVPYELSTSKRFPSKVNFEPVQTSHSDSSEKDSLDPFSERRAVSKSFVDLKDHESRSGESLVSSPVGEELTALGEGVQGVHHPLRIQLHAEESSDSDIDFQGFSSDEDENLVLKRSVFKDSKELAVKSTMMYVSKLENVRKPVNNKPLVGCGESSSSSSLREGRKQRSSVEIAINQLSDLEASVPFCSSKSADDKKQAPVLNKAPNITESLVQGGKSNDRDSIEERLAQSISCKEALKCGRISNEVTVTKASKPSQLLDKVAQVSNSQELDKVVPSSGHLPFAPSSIKSHPLIQSSMNELKVNKVTTSSNFNLLKEGTKPSSYCHSSEKVAPSSDNQLLKNKLTTSSCNRNLFKDAGTSTSENGPLKDKIPSNFPGPFPDKLAHQLSGSSLDRILQSAKTSTFLDSISLASNNDLAGDKTSLLLKNFKTDGVLALECVVYKEQNRQLQKELYLHREMLRRSEQQVSRLQSELDLRSKVPCTKCLNLKRGFIGKETLI